MKDIDIFSSIPEQFFIPLASKNKKVYIKIISLLYSLVESGLSYGAEKEIFISEIEDYLYSDSIDLETEDEEQGNSNRDKANILIRKLEEYSWIYTETTSDYKKIINFNDYSITVIEALLKIIQKEKLEYQGNIITIYTLLTTKEKQNAGIIIKQVHENTRGIMSALKTLNANIKKYMDNITKKMTPEDILEELFGRYTQDILDKAYHRLKTSENVSRYRPRIIESLQGLLNNKEFLMEAAIFYKNEDEEVKEEEAREEVCNIITKVINAFNDMDDIIAEIDAKNSKYIRASVTRAKFLLNNSKDTVGLLKNILEYTCLKYKELELNLSGDYLEELSDIFTIDTFGYCDETSLYVMAEGKKSFKPESLEVSNISEEDRGNRLREFKKNQEKRYSPKKINEIVNEILGNREKINASEIKINTIEEYVKLIYIRIYGNSSFTKYNIERKDTVVCKSGYSYRDFEIWRNKSES
ncbi:MAG: Wadjet anti-phage system protein JetA family protein [Clostridium sp.]|uniref:Wadjet anti-phage system protein JetA family protein n=1 Tax=Clostridium sp. TaxID=1506 RepID=UPI003F381F0F